MKKSLIALSLAVMASMSYAASGGEGGNTNCNGQGNPNSPCQGTGGQGGTGGTGGAGGAGGTGLGVGVGIANAAAIAAANAAAAANATAMGGNAAVVGSGNSNVRNTNTQGQQQGQQQSSRNRNTNTANGGNATGGNATGGAGGNSGGNVITVEGDKGDTYIAPAQERNPVATAYAAPLVSTNGTCMGSSSAGGQGASLGLSFGTTWTDNNCDIRYDAEALRAAGLPDAARARLCQKAEIKDAMAAAGTPCTDKAAARRAEAILNGATVASVDTPKPQYTDPIIRSRIGLPPLK